MSNWPLPHLVPRDRENFSYICDRCAAEKNAGRGGWIAGEGLDDVTVAGTLPLDQDEAWVACAHGHEHLVIRDGSERARNFGIGSAPDPEG